MTALPVMAIYMQKPKQYMCTVWVFAICLKILSNCSEFLFQNLYFRIILKLRFSYDIIHRHKLIDPVS